MYTYKAELVKVVDGDTIDVIINLGFDLKMKQRLRLAGIDTPEIRGKSREEGLQAKAQVKLVLETAQEIFVETTKKGKYGRYLAIVYYVVDEVDGAPIVQCLNDNLLEWKMAVKYDC